MSTAARAPSSAATIARSSLNAAMISAVFPFLRTAEGVSPDRSALPSHGYSLAHARPRVYAGGPGGSAPKNDFKIPEWPTKKGSGGSGHTRHTVRRIPRQAERNNGEREKAVVRPNGCSKKGAIRHERLDGQYPSLKASNLGTLAPSCKSACKRRAGNEVRAGNQTWRG